jgi:hypothetical protein
MSKAANKQRAGRSLPAELKGPLSSTRSLHEFGSLPEVRTTDKNPGSRGGFLFTKVKRYELSSIIIVVGRKAIAARWG